MNYDISQTQPRATTLWIPPLSSPLSDKAQFATADSARAYYESYDSVTKRVEPTRHAGGNMYSRTTLRYGAGFLVTVALALATFIVGIALDGAEFLGAIAVTLLAIAAVLALLWVSAAQREQQQQQLVSHSD